MSKIVIFHLLFLATNALFIAVNWQSQQHLQAQTIHVNDAGYVLETLRDDMLDQVREITFASQNTANLDDEDTGLSCADEIRMLRTEVADSEFVPRLIDGTSVEDKPVKSDIEDIIAGLDDDEYADADYDAYDISRTVTHQVTFKQFHSNALSGHTNQAAVLIPLTDEDRRSVVNACNDALGRIDEATDLYFLEDVLREQYRVLVANRFCPSDHTDTEMLSSGPAVRERYE